MATTQQELVDAVAKQLSHQDLSGQAVMVLHTAIENILVKVKQNIDAQITEDAHPIISTFVESLGTKVNVMTQQWADGVKNELVVFPEGTRYIYRDGKMTTIIVEQQPQIRNLRVQGANRLLALPYVQFIIVFNEHRPLKKLWVGCTKSPVTDIDQVYYHLPLPNISKHQVCLGDSQWAESGNMTEMVNQIITGFWSSSFTHDSSEHFAKFVTDNKFMPIDSAKRETTRDDWGEALKNWQALSKKDSSWIVSKESKLEVGGNFRLHLAKDSNSKDGTTNIVAKIKQEMLSAVSKIGGEVQNLIGNIDLTVENRKKVHISTLEGILKEIIVQAYAELWEHLQKQLAADKAKMQAEMQLAAKKLTNEFSYYINNGNKAGKK